MEMGALFPSSLPLRGVYNDTKAQRGATDDTDRLHCLKERTLIAAGGWRSAELRRGADEIRQGVGGALCPLH
jgi:hypothetical protein